jgi:hypothetical protein
MRSLDETSQGGSYEGCDCFLSSTAMVKAREKMKAVADGDSMKTVCLNILRSPINGSISNLADDDKASSSKSARKAEPFYQISLVITPVQPAHTLRAVINQCVPCR